MPALSHCAVGPCWCPECKAEANPVSAPAHYTRLNPQPLDIIDAWDLSFYPAQVVKYLARAGHKDPAKTLEDLEKAAFYLNRYIQKLKERK